MKRVFLIIAVAGMLLCHADVPQSSSEFVITAPKKKKFSTNDLKEQIGYKTKKTFQATTLLNQNMGHVQCAFAHVQKQFENAHAPHMKKMLQSGIAFNRAVGTIHHDLALMQQTCTSAVDKLINNKKPFKKASKATLETTLNLLVATNQQLESCAVSIKQLHTTLTTAKKVDDVHLKKLNKELEQHEKNIKKLRLSLYQDECLKQV